MTAREEVQALAAQMIKAGMAEHAGRAMDLIARDRPDLWARAMKEPVSTTKMAKAEPVQKATPKHWSVEQLQKRVDVLKQQQAAPLTDTAAWSAVLASPEGKTLVEAYYAAHPHLRRQG